MQIDIHYYATYSLARAAGITSQAARIIATASQFVNDNAEKDHVTFMDGAHLDFNATAHHAFTIKNISSEDQRRIWIPFHFLPGNEGDTYTERLICRKDSHIAREMVRHHISLADRQYALPLTGICAHVYADTFSHYGFSGVSSRLNKIDKNTIELENTKPEVKDYLHHNAGKFNERYLEEGGCLDNFKPWMAKTACGALGHGAALVCPDLPYLHWSFQFEKTQKHCRRKNPDTFGEACQALYGLFREFAARRPDLAEEEHMEFLAIKPIVEGILKLQGDKKDRIAAWKKAAIDGHIFAIGSEEIPKYDKNDWPNQRDNFRRKKDSTTAPGLPIYRFYQAAAIHRTYVLRHLLPEHDLVVS